MRFVLLAGAAATREWRVDVQVSRQHGTWGVMAGRWWVMPTYHPAAALRTPGLKRDIRLDLERFAAGVRGEETPSSMLWGWCVKCMARPMQRWDVDGLPWCELCWVNVYGAGRGKDPIAKTAKLWDEEKIEHIQERLEL